MEPGDTKGAMIPVRNDASYHQKVLPLWRVRLLFGHSGTLARGDQDLLKRAIALMKRARQNSPECWDRSAIRAKPRVATDRDHTVACCGALQFRQAADRVSKDDIRAHD